VATGTGGSSVLLYLIDDARSNKNQVCMEILLFYWKKIISMEKYNMENKSKRNQVITYNIHPQERQLPRNTHQSNSSTTGRIRKVLRTTLRSQTELESAHYQETETNWFKSKRNQLANREKIQPVYRKQTTSLQSGDQTHFGLTE